MSKKHLHNQAAIPLAPAAFKNTQMRPMIAEYDPKKKGVRNDLSELVMVKYKVENEDPLEQQAGSTLPLVEMPGRDVEADEDYNPFEHRKLAHPTSNMETLIHLLKGSLGSGILAMPVAFLNAGLWFGLFGIFAIGAICTYCVHVLVKTSHELCHRIQAPSLGFAETAEAAFLAGPPAVHKFSRLARALVNTFLVIDLLGCCCVYIVFVAKSVKQVMDSVGGPFEEGAVTPFYHDLDIRVYMAALLPILILLNLIKNLKYISPFSLIANILIGSGMGITFYYVFQDLPPLESRESFAGWAKLPTFFGTAIFALEGIGVVMPLENNMKRPRDFIGCPSVLNTGMIFVVSLYAVTGFFGFLKYGDQTQASITLNLPVEDVLGKCVKLMIAAAIFLTYNLQFYVPMDIIWRNIRHLFGARKKVADYSLRVVFVTMTVAIAIAIPNLGPFISLVGAVCLSTLGLMFPAILETITFWDRPGGLGRFNWVLWKNIFLVSFGVLGFVTGTYVSLLEIVYGTE